MKTKLRDGLRRLLRSEKTYAAFWLTALLIVVGVICLVLSTGSTVVITTP